MENSSLTGKKCPNCGELIEGNAKFCSSCGFSLANFCPNCGQVHTETAKFCASCGYAFTRDERTVATETAATKAIRFREGVFLLEKDGEYRLRRQCLISKCIRMIPAFLFALFTALMFAFMAAPLALDPFLGMSMGNVYENAGDPTWGLQGIAVTFIILACIFFVVGVVYALSVLPVGKSWRLKKELFLYDILLWTAIAVYALYVVLSIVCLIVMGNEGAGGSTFCVLLIIFSLLFLALTVVCAVLSRLPFGTRIENPISVQKPTIEPQKPVLAKVKECEETEKKLNACMRKIRKGCKVALWTFLIGWMFFAVFICALFYGGGFEMDYSSLEMVLIEEAYGRMALTAVLALVLVVIAAWGFSKIIDRQMRTKTEYTMYRIACSKNLKKVIIVFGIIAFLFLFVEFGIRNTNGNLIEEYSQVMSNYQYLNISYLQAQCGVLYSQIVLMSLAELFFISSFFIALLTRRVGQKIRKEFVVCTNENMMEMKEYLLAYKQYSKQVKAYELYLYDKEKYEKYAAENA